MKVESHSITSKKKIPFFRIECTLHEIVCRKMRFHSWFVMCCVYSTADTYQIVILIAQLAIRLTHTHSHMTDKGVWLRLRSRKRHSRKSGTNRHSLTKKRTRVFVFVVKTSCTFPLPDACIYRIVMIIIIIITGKTWNAHNFPSFSFSYSAIRASRPQANTRPTRIHVVLRRKRNVYFFFSYLLQTQND